MMIPLYKKLDPIEKENYSLKSLKSIHKQITSCLRDELSSCITGFRKSHGTQYSLIVMLEKWERAIHQGECFSALVMDFSKVFVAINHILMIPKLKAFGFYREALKIMQSYLKAEIKESILTTNLFLKEMPFQRFHRVK